MNGVDEVARAARDASHILAEFPPPTRAGLLLAAAAALDDNAEELVAIGERETGLDTVRLRGELTRTSVQLRLFADTVVAGKFHDARIDEADSDFALGVRPDLRRALLPIGPVLNFAASNFPFAFSVAGGDTASALAAGCAVIVKAHPGHPELSQRTAEIVRRALADAGAPAGTLQLIEGQDEGVAMLMHPLVAAASFTGSLGAGRFLADVAASRPAPIPFYGELGSLNPVVVTAAALAERAEMILTGFAGSVTGSAGQLCTKPGFLFVPAGTDVGPRVGAIVSATREHRLLYPKIADGYAARRATVVSTPGVAVHAAGGVRFDSEGHGWVLPTIVSVSLSTLARERERLLDESFGPLSIVVEYDDTDALVAGFTDLFEGSLTAGLHLGVGETSPWITTIVETMSDVAGRVLFDGWPTGVAVTPAQQHGGPWPATTTSTTTSVGTAAIQRFLRPVAYQNAPASLLPPVLRDDNPWNVEQRRSSAGESRRWGEAAAAQM
ncbi:MAG: aldehyde dehydrogenase [Microbacteriaceae bacterium]|nr:aldehyde dehydrogenase [Microbacteriaceae bacterium]